MNDEPFLPFFSSPASPSGRFGLPERLHDFRSSLAMSEAHSQASWWLDLYRRAFPSMISSASVRQDGWAQRGGIDRVITLASGRVYTVDEKVRAHDWPDILLEQWSDEDRRAPGWVQKPLACDFIAYAFAPSRKCYLLPVVPLQRAWRLSGRRWLVEYGQRRAENVGYTSVNVPVPIETLLAAMAAAMLLKSPGPADGAVSTNPVQIGRG